MRSRSNSGVRLDYYQRLVKKTILQFQNPATGLIPASTTNSHAWVRDNIYSILAVWGLSMAYRKNADLDEDRAKAYELEQSVVKLMRGVLHSFMMQMDKLEKFKRYQHPMHSLHAKFDSLTGKAVVGDQDWGHLQIDATSLFVLMVAQMTASGLRIIFNLGEVALIQNLVFYIETAYRTPDFGIWERGDKTNQGVPELNSSSIGMAKAALDAINEVDLFGSRGGARSVIHVLPDEAQMCEAILNSMLPRESSSKETDSALLGIISYPAFAVSDPDLIELTKKTIKEKLQGKYGCSRFLRDGYKTPVEDNQRLYYEPGELQCFEKIECQWPLMFTYLALDALFNNQRDLAKHYLMRLEDLMVKGEDGSLLLPELYRVPADKVHLERGNPGSQSRDPIGMLPHRWGQSLYVLGKLLLEGFISPGEIDPLNRRLISEPKPDVVVQVVILAENLSIQERLSYLDINIQTVSEVCPIEVYRARLLGRIYSALGKNSRLSLTGRATIDVGLLATSKLYKMDDQIFAFFPQFVDQGSFYLPLDTNFFIDTFGNNIEFLASNWNVIGRPIIILPIVSSMLEGGSFHPALISTLKKVRTGYINGTRVVMGDLMNFKTTSCVTNLNFIECLESSSDYDRSGMDKLRHIIGQSLTPSSPRNRLMRGRGSRLVNKGCSAAVSGLVKRTRSIQITQSDSIALSAYLMTKMSSSPDEPDETFSPSLQARRKPIGTTERRRAIGLPEFFGADMTDVPVPHLKMGTGYNECPIGSHKNVFSTHVGLEANDANINELLKTLQQSESMQEQADIIHYLYLCKGLSWDTNMGDRSGSTVKDLLIELYEKASHAKQWWLVRHTAGMLEKRVEDLALAATDLLVRQKQLSIGLPPEPREKIITSPLPPDELAKIIFQACGDDMSTAALTQEILVYLAMFIRTEPKLFNEMLRLRVGLILQVMASELARTLKCSGEDASDQLLNLSPFEMKTLLHHILSGKEFVIYNEPIYRHKECESDDEYRISVRVVPHKSQKLYRGQSVRTRTPSSLMAGASLHDKIPLSASASSSEDDTTDRQGQWLRRRRLDGALNRSPVGFYTGVWKILNKCSNIIIEGYTLNQNLTKEMTTGELKFALQVEMVLNRIPQPEYRQLMVEALMVVISLTESDSLLMHMHQVIRVDHIVRAANSLFINENGMPDDVVKKSEGAAGISQFFYDTAPSGRYGTMAYLCKALAKSMQLSGQLESLECSIS